MRKNILAGILSKLNYGLALIVLLGLPVAGSAQETGIVGRVTDQSGAVIATVKVTLTSETGLRLTSESNAEGLYQFPSLRGSTYVVRAEAPGFSPAEKTVQLLVGQAATVDITLLPGSVVSSVNVSSDAAAVDTSSSAVAGNISPAEVNALPLNGRNWMELSMLVPGIVRNAVDFTPLNSGGDYGRYQINVDGQQMTQNAGSDISGQPQFSRDAIDQFQIITNRFDATLGRSLQIQINAQTKSGSPHYHGTLFGYFRNDAFNAGDPVAHKVLPFSDQQFGGTLGGPIVKDKLWFFFAQENERQPYTLFFTPNGFPGLNFTFPSNLTNRSYLLRFDYQINEKHRITVRGTGYTYDNPFTDSSTTDFPSRAFALTRTSYAGLVSWTWVKSSSTVNELKLGYNHYDWLDTPIVSGGQEYRFPSVTAGTPYNYPQNFVQDSEQVRDDLFWLKGTHNIKTGVDYLHTAYTGLFQQYIRGAVTSFASQPTNLTPYFPVWNDPSTWNLSGLSAISNTYVQGFGNFNIDVPVNALGAWVQDDWKITPRLTLNLGLRYDNDLGIWDPSLRLKSGVKTPTSSDNLLFAPRLGFVYDVMGDRKTVIRGGAGLFYADISANPAIDAQIFNGEASLQPSIQATTGHPINLSNPFNGVTGDQFLSGAVPVSTQAIQVFAPDVRTPMSLQLSIGVQRSIKKSWTLTADYIHWRIYHDFIRSDANTYYDPATGYNKNPTTAGRPNPNFTTILTFYTPDAAGSLFDSVQVGLQHSLSKGFSGSFAYSLSKLKDSTNGPFYTANNPYNWSAEWGNSQADQRHTIETSLSYAGPWGLQLSGTFHFGSGQAFQTLAGSNPFGGTVTNRTFVSSTKVYNNPANNVPVPGLPGYSEVVRDSLYGQPIYRLDLRLSKTIILKERFRFIPSYEVFNVLNHSNYGTYNTTITAASFAVPAQNSNLGYAARMMQFAGRFEF